MKKLWAFSGSQLEEWRSEAKISTTTMLWRPVQHKRKTAQKNAKYTKYLLQISFLFINSEISRSDMQRQSRFWSVSTRMKCATMMSWDVFFFLCKQTTSFLSSIAKRARLDNVKKKLVDDACYRSSISIFKRAYKLRMDFESFGQGWADQLKKGTLLTGFVGFFVGSVLE